MWILVLISLALLWLTWQDFKDRAVYGWLFPVLLLLFLVKGIASERLSFHDVLTNLLVLAMQFGLLSLYFWVKDRRFLMQGEHYLGWGDILMLLVLTVCFSPVNFIFFLVAGFFLVLSVVGVLRLAGKPIRYIPLAGGQALLLVSVLWWDYFSSSVDTYGDEVLIRLLLGF